MMAAACRITARAGETARGAASGSSPYPLMSAAVRPLAGVDQGKPQKMEHPHSSGQTIASLFHVSLLENYGNSNQPSAINRSQKKAGLTEIIPM